MQAFTLIDNDRDGVISVSDLKAIFQSVGMHNLFCFSFYLVVVVVEVKIRQTFAIWYGKSMKHDRFLTML